MNRSHSKHFVLIVSINQTIRLEFQTYLHNILGNYISFDTIGLEQVREPAQLKGYQCILFSSSLVQSEFPLPIPENVAQIVCTRTFNHAFLDQIIRIPPGERVYIVNDTCESIVTIIEQLENAGVIQYQFEPYYPGCPHTDESIHYAITIGEPHLVPKHITNVIDIGNRIIDISTVNELCEYFQLPASLSNQITSSYVNSILQIARLSSTYYQDYIYSHQLLQTVISNLPLGLCLLSARGEIIMANRRFSIELELPETGTSGHGLTQFLPQPWKGTDFCHSADYRISNRSGEQLLLSSLELLLPNHEPLYLLTNMSAPALSEGSPEQISSTGSLSADSRHTDRIISGITTISPSVKEILNYARRLSLYDFPVLIQGESGTQKKLIAETIHKLSARRQKPLIYLSMPLESSAQLLNLFEAANHGTLLIDSADKLPPDIQGLLAGTLQKNRTGNLSGFSSSTFDVRIIATSIQDLYQCVENETFNSELFFLLNAAIVDTIPLREHSEDIPLLLEQFFRELFHNNSLKLHDILSPSLLNFLLDYHYPGNVQELYNLAQYFFSRYAAHPLILAQLPSYIRKRMNIPCQSQNPLRLKVLSIIAASPRIGRGGLKQALADADLDISDGRLRGLLKELSDESLIRINRTRGGCEITELGLTSIKS